MTTTAPHLSTDPAPPSPPLPDGLVVVVKRECETCQMVAPVLAQLAAGPGLTVYTQDDPAFPDGLDPVLDADLALSWHHDIETVPTLIKVVDGDEVERTVGWHRPQWEAFERRGRPRLRPPGVPAGLRVAVGRPQPRRRPAGALQRLDPAQPAGRAGRRSRTRSRPSSPAAGPTASPWWRRPRPRVLRMLEGTTRSPDEVVAVVPPDLVEVTVEKVAINAVMAGCKPEYLPVVLACVEAACTDEFNIHGVLATTMPVGPVVIVNGPIRRAIGMNAGVNVLGQGNRANSTHRPRPPARRPQRRRRAARRGRPGRPTATPARCRSASPRTRRARRGSRSPSAGAAEEGRSTVTLFAGEGPRCIVDQKSPRARVAGVVDGRVPAHRPPPEAPARVRRHPRRRARARPGVRRGGLEPPAPRGRAAGAAPAPGRGDRAGRGRHRRRRPGLAGRRHAAQVPSRRDPDRARRRRRGPVLCHHRRVGQRRRRQPT